MEEIYMIRKEMTDKYGKKINLLMTDGYSEILELDNFDQAEKLALVLNDNSDSGWFYSVVVVKKI